MLDWQIDGLYTKQCAYSMKQEKELAPYGNDASSNLYYAKQPWFAA